jgi:hypothetical protein
MITIYDDVPDKVAAFSATGEVTGADYDNVLIPVVEKNSPRIKKSACSIIWVRSLPALPQVLCGTTARSGSNISWPGIGLPS